MLAIAGKEKNDFFQIWPTRNFAHPKYIVKSLKDGLIGIAFDLEKEILIAGVKNEDSPIKIYKMENYE